MLDGAIKFPATLSHIVIAVGFVLALGGGPFNLAGSVVILMLAYLALYFPQTSVATDNAVAQVGRELPEASRVGGAGEGRTFRRIYLPLMAGGLAAGWALLFVRCVGDLTASSILAGPRQPRVGWKILQVYTDGSYSEMAALSVVLTLDLRRRRRDRDGAHLAARAHRLLSSRRGSGARRSDRRRADRLACAGSRRCSAARTARTRARSTASRST